MPSFEDLVGGRKYRQDQLNNARKMFDKAGASEAEKYLSGLPTLDNPSNPLSGTAAGSVPQTPAPPAGSNQPPPPPPPPTQPTVTPDNISENFGQGKAISSFDEFFRWAENQPANDAPPPPADDAPPPPADDAPPPADEPVSGPVMGLTDQQRSELFNRADQGDFSVLNNPNLSDEDRAYLTQRLESLNKAQADSRALERQSAERTPTQVARPVDATNTATRQAMDSLLSQPGFSDDQIRQQQQNTVNQLVRQSEAAGQSAARQLAPPDFTPTALETTLEARFLRDLLTPQGEDDAITRAQRSRFETSAEDRRRQLIEDLNRFNVLGGQGVSGGNVADVLGRYDAGIEQGALDLSAQQQQRRQQELFNAILPFQQGQSGLRQRQGEFEFGANQARIGTQQDVADRTLARLLTITEPTGREQFEENVRQARVGEDLSRGGLLGVLDGQRTVEGQRLDQQSDQFRQQQANLLGQAIGLDDRVGTTLGAQALQEQRAARQSSEELALAELLGMTESGQQTLGARRLTQQGQQFDRSAGQQDEALALERAQATGNVYLPGVGYVQTVDARRLESDDAARDRQLDLALAELTGRTASGTETLGARQLTQAAQDAQAARDLQRSELTGQVYLPGVGYVQTVGRDRLDLQDRTQRDAQELALAELLGMTESGQQTLGAQRLDQQGDQFDRSFGLQQSADERADQALMSELFGYAFNPDGQRVDTIQGRLTNDQLATSSLERTLAQSADDRADRGMDLTEAELLGILDGRETLESRLGNRANQLALAELTGTIDGNETLSGQRMSREDAALAIQMAQLNDRERQRVINALQAIGLDIPTG